MKTAYPTLFSSIYPLHRLLILLTYLSKMDQSLPLVQRGSTSFDSDLSTRYRPVIALPSASTPDATPRQVRKFFKQCFLVNRTELGKREAQEEEATLLSIRLCITNNSLYKLSKKNLIIIFNTKEEIIYDILQSRKFGYVSL